MKKLIKTLIFIGISVFMFNTGEIMGKAAGSSTIQISEPNGEDYDVTFTTDGASGYARGEKAKNLKRIDYNNITSPARFEISTAAYGGYIYYNHNAANYWGGLINNATNGTRVNNLDVILENSQKLVVTVLTPEGSADTPRVTHPTIYFKITPSEIKGTSNNQKYSKDYFAGSHNIENSEQHPSSSGGATTLLRNQTIGKHPDSTGTTFYDRLKEKVGNFTGLIKILTTFFYGVAILTSALVIVLSIVKLAASSSHPIKRYAALMELLTSFFCVAALGAITIFVKLLFELILS